jgi:predicted transcriptional regulator
MTRDAEHQPDRHYTVRLADLSGPEADVMRVLETRRSATAREVYEALSVSQLISYTTVMGTLGGLTAKGLVDRTWCGTAKHYAAAASNVAMARSVVNDVVANLLGGNAQPVIAYLEKYRHDVDRVA